MAKPTKRELISRKLEQRGYRLNLRRSTSKYDCYTTQDDRDNPYWIGKAGAVRVGRTITDSLSVTDSVDWKALYSEHYHKELTAQSR